MNMATAKTVEAILNKEDKAVDHILLQNKALSVKIDELKQELRDVIKEKEDMEEENDSITKSKNILQGYMKNFHEMNKLEIQLKQSYLSSFKHYRRIYYILVCNTIMFYMMVLNIDNPFMQFVTYNTFVAAVIGFSYHNRKNEVMITQKNQTLMDELNKLHKATDMVTDLMDNL